MQEMQVEDTEREEAYQFFCLVAKSEEPVLS